MLFRSERKGPKRKSKLTADTVATITRLREGGASYRAIASDTGVSDGSVRNALRLADDGMAFPRDRVGISYKG